MEEQLCLRFNVCGPGKEWQIRVKRGKKIAVRILSAAVVVLLFAVLQRLVQPKYADDILEGILRRNTIRRRQSMMYS